MGNVMEPIQRGKEQDSQSPAIASGSFPGSSDDSNDENTNFESPTNAGAPQGVSFHSQESSGGSGDDVEESRLTGENDSLATNGATTSCDTELSTGSQSLDLNSSKQFEETDGGFIETEQVSQPEEAQRLESLVGDIKETVNISQDFDDEDEELNSRIFESYQNTDNWRSSIASTMTDVSESYQTALEDSDRDEICRTDDDIDDDDVQDSLTTTLCSSELQDQFSNGTSNKLDILMTMGKTESIETITYSEEFETSLLNVEVEPAADEHNGKRTDTFEVCPEPVAITESKITDLSQQDIDSDFIQHNILTLSQTKDISDIQDDLPIFENLQNLKNCSEPRHSEALNEDCKSENILSDRCPTLSDVSLESNQPSLQDHSIEPDATSQSATCGEDVSCLLDGDVTERPVGASISASGGDDPIQLTSIWNNSSGSITDEAISANGNNDDLNQVVTIQQHLQPTDDARLNLKLSGDSDGDNSGSENVDGGEVEGRNCSLDLEFDEGTSRLIELHGNVRDDSSILEGDVVDHFTPVASSRKEDSCEILPQTAEIANTDETSDSFEENEIVELVLEPDKELTGPDDDDDNGDGDDLAAVLLMRSQFASLLASGARQEQDDFEGASADSYEMDAAADSENDAVCKLESSSDRIKSDESDLIEDLTESENVGFETGVNQMGIAEEDMEEEDDEPEPDYSLSSDDEDSKSEGGEHLTLELGTESGKFASGDVSVLPSPPADYLNSPLGREEAFFNVMAQSGSTFAELQSLEPASAESPEDGGITLEHLQTMTLPKTDVVVDDDEDESFSIGNFKRRTSMRPSKRSRSGIFPKRSNTSTSSVVPEVPEILEGETETALNELVFAETPRSAGIDLRSPFDAVRELDAGDSVRARTDASHPAKNRSEMYERRKATIALGQEVSSEPGWVPYSVVLRKDAEGFGITLSYTDNPVIISKVDLNGVAARSGVRSGDQINKINGTLVYKLRREEVVEKIRSSGLLVRMELLRLSSESVSVPTTPALLESGTPKPLKATSLPTRHFTEQFKSLRFSSSSSFANSPENVRFDLVDKAFTDLRLLKQKPAHLAIFLQYLLVEDDPYPMLFSIISDYYQNCPKESQKSIKRWAYEIYSTFLAAKAPLKLNVDDRRVHRLMHDVSQAKMHELTNLFLRINDTIKRAIDQQLGNFVEKKFQPNVVPFNLLKMSLDRAVEFQIIDEALWKSFEQCLAEDHDDTKRAIAYSLATFFRQVGFTGTRNSSHLNTCPTFLSNDKKSLKNKMKKQFALSGHQLSPRQFTAVTHCHYCQKVIWGLGHQAYECYHCGVSFHRRCTENPISSCSGSRSKRSMRDIISVPGRRHPTLAGRDDSHRNFGFPSFFEQETSKGLTLMEQVEAASARLSVPEGAFEGVFDPLMSRFTASDDSDLEVPSELPELTDFIPKEDLRQLKDKDRKRQQIINELFHTERLHVQSLKILNKVFLQPMLKDPAFDPEFIDLLFPNLHELLRIHDNLKKEFILKRKQKKVIGDIGQLLVRKFSGPSGKRFKEACARFCADQAFALETLKAKQKKEPKISAFLQEAALNPLCKRLELKDFLPRQMHRLTKYPLLIESLRKCTPPVNEEFSDLSEALNLTKSLLEHVNQEAKVVQNHRHLKDMQQRLDQRAADSSSHPMLKEYKNFNMTSYTLVYDGDVTWQPFQPGARPIEIRLVLFEEILVVLLKQDDRLLLRSSSTTVEDFKFKYCPIMKLNHLVVKDVPTDRRSFFVLDSALKSLQVYEFRAHSRDEKNKWCNHIQETVKRCIIRQGTKSDSTDHASSGDVRPKKDKSVFSLIVNDNKVDSCQNFILHDTTDHHSEERTREPASIRHHVKNEKVGGNLIAAHGNLDSCGNKIDDNKAKMKTLKESTSLIIQLLREKIEILTGIRMNSDDFGEDQFLASDTKEIIKELLRRIALLRELIDQQQQQRQRPENATNEAFDLNERLISLPAERVYEHTAVIQRLLAHLADNLIASDVEEMEKLNQEFQSVCKSIEVKDVANVADLAERLSNDPVGKTEGGVASPSTRSLILEALTDEESLSRDRSDQNENINTDL